MSRRASFFVRLDGDWMEDEKIRQLRRKDGYEGVGVYLALLTLMIRYKDTAYQIPYTQLDIIAEEDIHIPSERLYEIVNDCIDISLFKFGTDLKTFYSARRKNELMAAEKTREKQSEGGKKAMQKRWFSDSNNLTNKSTYKSS